MSILTVRSVKDTKLTETEHDDNHKLATLMIETVAILKTKAGDFDNQIINLQSYYAGIVGGGQQLFWDATSTETANDGTIFQVTGVVTGRWKSVDTGVINAKLFGAKGDGVTDDHPSIQAMLDYFGLVSVLGTSGGQGLLDKGVFVSSDTLKLKSSWASIFGKGPYATIIKYTGAAGTAAIQIGSDITDQTTVYNYNSVQNLAIQVITAGAYGIRYDKSQHGTFRTLSINLTAANQIGFYGKGNGSGAAPYYCAFEDIVVIGSTLSTQVGFGFYLNNTAFLDAPNGNMFTNIKQVQSVGTAFDLQAGQGNHFVNVGLESVSGYGFKLSDKAAAYTGTATGGTSTTLIDTGQAFVNISNGTIRITAGTGSGATIQIRTETTTVITFMQEQSFTIDNTSVYEVYDGRCADTKITGLRYEDGGAIIYSNGYGANKTQVAMTTGTGASAIWENLSLDQDSSFGTSSGQLVPFTFQVSGLAANTTTNLLPVGVAGIGISGGWRMPKAGNIVSVSTSIEGFATSGGLGQATIKTYQSATQKTALDHIINQNTSLGYTQVAGGSDTQYTRNTAITVRATTDATWNQTGILVTVIVWMVF